MIPVLRLLPILAMFFFLGQCMNDPDIEKPKPKPPPPPRVTVPRPEALYRQNGCESCHGKVGSGNPERKFSTKIPDLRVKGEYKQGHGLEAIQKTIRKGVPGSEMRAYTHLSREEVQSIAKYVVELQTPPNP